ncbi:MAG: DUF177 domain-containing protein [Negativicutes bacterium]|nr:DUF177 domain-containing protein [Negativicutes bacterium]
MKINVSALKKEIGSHQPFHFDCNTEQLFPGGEMAWVSGQVSVEGTIVNNGRLLEVAGTAAVTARMECGRCLETFYARLELPFHELYQEQIGLSDQFAEEDLAVFRGDEVDITELVRETLILGEPLNRVCDSACKGLCPQCGVNRNFNACSCQTASVDPRLAALKKLLEN